jgi:Ran GTPase-activating protein 1
MSGSKVYSIHGRGLKLDSKEDIEPYLKELQALTSVEEIHIGGQFSQVGRNKKKYIPF